MPEGEIGAGSEEGGGKGEEGGSGVLTLPGGESGALDASSPDDLPTGTYAEVLAFMREEWRAERERAERAEREMLDLRERLASAEAALAEARAAIDEAERRHQIDLRLIESETVDLESSRLLTELALREMPEADVALAVRDLRRRKPFLFRTRRAIAEGGAAMSPAAATEDPAFRAAQEASRNGDRGALLRYLRARRGA